MAVGVRAVRSPRKVTATPVVPHSKAATVILDRPERSYGMVRSGDESVDEGQLSERGQQPPTRRARSMRERSGQERGGDRTPGKGLTTTTIPSREAQWYAIS